MARANYGIDAPGLVRGFFFGGVGLGLFGFALHHFLRMHSWLQWVGTLLLFAACYFFFMFVYMLWGSLVAKVRGRDAILDMVRWSGDEKVLDVGCGRGLLLIGAARRLTTGNAVGVDLWVEKDQGSNSAMATLANAELESVADRVSVETGDMRQLPFEDNTFDVVLSSWALHNLESKEDRRTALAEMVRVLTPGGTSLLNDIANRDEYEAGLKRIDMLDVRVVIGSRWHDLFSGMVSFGSFRPATVVARKPNLTEADSR